MSNPNHKPVIGITIGTSDDWRKGGASFESYASAIREAGGEVRRMGKGVSMDLKKVSGLLIPGGWDIHPDRYERLAGDEQLSADDVMAKYGVRCEAARDETELPLLEQALEMGMPVLAICRGIQSLNIVLTRRLLPDLPTCVPNSLHHKSPGSWESLRHEIDIAPGSLLERVYGGRKVVVNTRHHQGMTPDMVSDRLKVTALAPDGIVEAVESADGRFIVGVQWHPERKKDPFIHDISGPLFKAFVQASTERK